MTATATATATATVTATAVVVGTTVATTTVAARAAHLVDGATPAPDLAPGTATVAAKCGVLTAGRE